LKRFNNQESKVGKELRDEYLHVDGYRASLRESRGFLDVVVQLVSGNEVVQDSDFTVYSAHVDGCSIGEQHRALDLAQAMCRFFNTGGKYADLAYMFNRARSFSEIDHPFELLGVFPGHGSMTLWRKPDGTYLKAVDGDEGFVESLTKAEVMEWLGQEEENPVIIK
jgi:hypothetical protein